MSDQPKPGIYPDFQSAMMAGVDSRMKWWEHIYYPCYRKLSDIRYWLKKMKQRVTTGFPHEQAWNLNIYHAKWVVPRLKMLRDMNCGYPHDFTEETWKAALDEMVWAFENYGKDIAIEYPDDYDHRHEVEVHEGSISIKPLATQKVSFDKSIAHNDRVQKGIDLFAKYYFHLWD